MKCWFHRILLLFCLTLPAGLFAQSEAEIQEKAGKLFREEQFVEATPLYLRLLSLAPRNTYYNYCYGTCLLFNSDNKENALRYLNYAVTDPEMNPEAWYYLGKALQLNYQFNEAIKNYMLYLDKAGSRANPELQTERQIETCRNGKKLMTTITDLIVSSKTEIGIDKFYRLYDLANIGGTILVNAEFQSKVDRRRGHIPLVYFPTGAKQIFYSSYGDDDSNGLDIYIRRRLPTGEWGEPQRVNGGVNSGYDEDFPYMHPGGQYLYFSSKGHNSMGGYDVFRCRFDPDNNSFGPPENMDFAISSPDDDIFYIVDSLGENAWFASARQSSDNKVYVYKTHVDRVPIQLAVVKGDFKSSIRPGSRIKITINDFATGNEIGRFGSNERKSYLITFPKGGKYEYVMQVEGSDETYKAVVSIPFLREFKPLKQLIVHEETTDGPIIRVIDQFDQEVEDAQGVIAQVLKERSNLDVNEQEFDLEKIRQQAENREILNELGLEKYGLSEIADLLQSRESVLSEQEHFAENKAQRILVQVQENTAESNALDKQARALTNEANKAATNLEKKALLEQARALIDEQETLASESRELLAIYDSLGASPPNSAGNENEQQLAQLVSDLRKAVSEESEEQALALLRDQQALVEKALNADASGEQAVLMQQKAKIDADIKKLEQEKNGYITSVDAARSEIRSLEEQLETARKKDRANLNRQISSKENEARLLEDQVAYLAQKEEQLRLEREAIDHRVSLNKLIAANALPGQPLTKESVRKDYLAASSTNSNSLRKYVDDELQKLQDDAIASARPGNVKRYVPAYEAQKEAILSDDRRLPGEKQAALNELREQTLADIEEQLSTLENELRTNPGNEANVAAFEELRQERDQLLSEQTTAIQPGVSSETVLAELVPDHESRALGIRNNELLDPAEREKQLLVEEERVLQVIRDRQTEVRQQLEAQPDNTILQDREKALTQLEERFEDLAARHRKELDKLNAPETADSKESVLALVFPRYEERLNAIDSNENLAETEKQQQRLSLEENLLEAVNREIAKTDADSPDPVERKKARYLDELRAEQEGKLLLMREELAATTTSVSRDRLMTEVYPAYDEERAAIESAAEMTEAERNEALDALNETLLRNLDRRKDLVEKDLVSHPDDKTLLAEKELIENLARKAHAEIDARAGLANQPESDSRGIPGKEALLSAVNPNYTADRKRIEADRALSEERQLAGLLDLDRDMLRTVRERLAELDAKTSPTDREKAEMQALRDAANDLEQTISRQADRRVKILVGEIERDALLEESVPGYRQKLEATANEPAASLKLIRDAEAQLKEAIRREDLIADGDPELHKACSEVLTALLEANAAEQEELEKRLAETTTTQTSETQAADLEIIRMALRESAGGGAELFRDPSAESSKEALAALDDKLAAYETSLANELDNHDTGRSEAEKQVLTEELEQVRDQRRSVSIRVGELETLAMAQQSGASENPDVEKLLDQARTESGVNSSIFNTPVNDLSMEALKQQNLRLSAYERELEKQLATLPPTNEKSYNAINTELERVREKKRLGSIRIGELETLAIEHSQENSTISSARYQDSELNAIRSEKTRLQESLGSAGNAAERRKIEAKIGELDRRENERVSEIVGKELLEGAEENRQAVSTLAKIAGLAETKTVLYENDRRHQEVENLVQEAENTRDPKARRYLLEEARSKQVNANLAIEEATARVEIWQIEAQENISLQSEADLEARRRQVIISIGEIEYEVEQLQEEESRARRKDRERIEQELGKAAEALRALQQEKEALEEELAARHVEPSLAPGAIEAPLSYQEEYELETSDSYKTLYAQNAEVQELREDLERIDREADRLRRKIRSGSVSVGEADLDALRQLEAQRKELAGELEQKQSSLQEQITREEAPMKIQNLLARGIPPLSQIAIGTSVIAMPAAGLEISERKAAPEIKTSIPVDVRQPAGLVYRIQIGAFARPIPETTFSEFNPVSGEKLSNGITRYMAGYFASEAQGLDARARIRKLGYSDAFLVAYCDGERISIPQARRLMASGACIPQGQETLVMEASRNTAEKLGLQDTSKARQVSPTAYNQAPGAAPAEAAETRKGLFYTVQIGVYNRPVPHSQLKNIEPLITKRLENGQIRYSSGIFRSVDEARPKQHEAIDRGIRDAFITAYYRGERITLSEAANLLAQHGPSILEPVDLPAATGTKSENIVVVVTADTNDASAKMHKPDYFQLVSTEKYDSYPREVLKRYNTQDSFYYDRNDSLIKSARMSNPDLMAGLRRLPAPFDTLRVEPSSEADTSMYRDLQYELQEHLIPGALNDYLLRLNYEKYWERTETGYRLTVYRVRREEAPDVRHAIEQLLPGGA